VEGRELATIISRAVAGAAVLPLNPQGSVLRSQGSALRDHRADRIEADVEAHLHAASPIFWTNDKTSFMKKSQRFSVVSRNQQGKQIAPSLDSNVWTAMSGQQSTTASAEGG
jgi:hypothetical protein